MNKQMIFNLIVNHLLTQMEKAQTPQGDCVYRMPERHIVCAIGCLIKDSEYTEGMESSPLTDVVFDPFMERIGATADGDIVWLGSIQTIHDQFAPSEWRKKLILFAKTHNLEFNHVSGQGPIPIEE